jgi:hypothetical protein
LGVAGGYAITQAKLQAGVQAEPAAPTVGEFAVRLASQMKLTKEVATPEQALTALRAAGLVGGEPLNLGAPLTESTVVRLTNPLKLGLTTQSPDRQFSREQTNTFFSVFAGALRQGAGRTSGAGSLGGVRALAAASSIMNGSEPPDDGGQGAGPCGDSKGANPCERGRGKKKGLSPDDPD